tara:strand:+ start:1839 stop:2594 length:756 start_codon:yes stop_codon:yes gene_type:complete
MNYKKYLLIFILFASCSSIERIEPISKNQILRDSFKSNGFTLLFNDSLKNDKIVSKKIDERSLTIFQNNLKKGTSVKITNLLNNKSLIAKVGDDINYPSFFNSVISKRIFTELEIDISEPYIQIYEINENSIFVAKKAKTFDEEKEVANKAPVDGISIKDLNVNNDTNKNNKKKKNFNYIIKIADFYFEDTAKMMKKRILNETNIKKVYINTISNNSFRVFLGPFKDLKSLENDFNSIKKLNFENIEFLKQ